MYINKIKNALKNLGSLADLSVDTSSSVQLQKNIEDIDNQISEGKLIIDVLYLGNFKNNHFGLHIDDYEKLKQTEFLMLITPTYKASVFTPNAFPHIKLNELQASLKIIFFENDLEINEDIEYAIHRFLKNGSVLYVVLAEEKPDFRFEFITSEDVNKKHYLSVNDFISIEHFLAQKEPEYLNVLKMLGIITTLIKLAEYFDIILHHEIKDLDGKKMAISKELEANKKATNSKELQDVFTQLKNNLSKSASEFEIGIADRFGKITKVQEGSLYYNLDNEIQKLNILKEVEADGEILLELPDSVTKLMDWMRSELIFHLDSDITSLNDFLQASVAEVKEKFKKLGFHSDAVQFDLLDKSKIVQLLEQNTNFEKEFEGKCPGRNFFSIFNAIRQPIFVLMSVFMITGLILGQDALKTFRDSSAIQIVSILLLLFGVYYAFANLKKEKRKKMKEEVKKAKLYLASETKRMLTVIEREWKQVFFDFLRKQIKDIIETSENELKNFSVKINAENVENNQITQRKMLNANNQEKKLNNSQREKQNFDSKLQQLGSEIKMELLKFKV